MGLVLLSSTNVETPHRIRPIVGLNNLASEFFQLLLYDRRRWNPLVAIAYEGRTWVPDRTIGMWQVEEYNSTGFQLPDPFAKSLSPVLDVLQAMGTENIVE